MLSLAIDRIILRARGGVWHQKHQLPHTSIDPEAHWTKSGWQCSRLRLETARRLRRRGGVVSHRRHPDPANVADIERAPTLGKVPADVRFVLGDRHYNVPELRSQCEQEERLLVTTRYGRYPHTGDGVEVRRIFRKLRSVALENFNKHFTSLI